MFPAAWLHRLQRGNILGYRHHPRAGPVLGLVARVTHVCSPGGSPACPRGTVTNYCRPLEGDSRPVKRGPRRFTPPPRRGWSVSTVAGPRSEPAGRVPAGGGPDLEENGWPV